MAITCDAQSPLFPPVNNEDLLVDLTRLSEDPTSAHVTGTLEQDTYAHFANSTRASAQEFGEVLTKGYGPQPDLTELHAPLYWKSVLQDRRRLVREAAADLEHREVTEGELAMQVVLATHGPDWPELLAGFVGDWAHDRLAWQNYLSSLQSLSRTVEETLRPDRK
ncbi:hypothetical protein AB0M83_40460 [Amycolatopsis sp. NPDC051106]|uniref:hypothetical protein n=1 Tax=unclassified Amycolatopsis TaxID=2618356 RepID=UPI00343455DD